jgi:hypothetical protein
MGRPSQLRSWLRQPDDRISAYGTYAALITTTISPSRILMLCPATLQRQGEFKWTSNSPL